MGFVSLRDDILEIRRGDRKNVKQKYRTQNRVIILRFYLPFDNNFTVFLGILSLRDKILEIGREDRRNVMQK